MCPSESSVIFHIAAMYQSPWRPTLHRVEALPSQPVVGEMSVRVTGEWLSLWKALETLDINLAWGVRCFTLLERRSAVVVFNPAVVNLQRSPGEFGRFMRFWTPTTPTRSRASEFRRLALEDALDAVEVDGDEEAEEQADDEVALGQDIVDIPAVCDHGQKQRSDRRHGQGGVFVLMLMAVGGRAGGGGGVGGGWGGLLPRGRHTRHAVETYVLVFRECWRLAIG